ncbi:DUF6287 domain-containing protein [Streptococcus sp. DD10]|uniref:DUF6287 domain-containing protein n=1 Tax=Streptococcus sp. DD10 TaxID=1777878 RepID=UPI00082E21A0|nr:DUF6287 domain-containing protein [Streptococcus sp. DD10]
MKQYLSILLASLALLSLTACGTKQIETQSSNSSTEVSSSKKEVKDTGQAHYQPVLDRYKNYLSALKAKNRPALQEELGKLGEFTGESELIYNFADSSRVPDLQYAFVDLNKDDQDELLVGEDDYLSAIYYLKDAQPELLHVAYVGSVGGGRSGLAIYDNGQVSYASGQSTKPEMTLKLYTFTKEGVKQDKEATYQIGGEETAEQILGISASQVDVAKFDWKDFEQETQSSSSTSTASESSATKAESTNATGMDINAIATGDFSSIAGTWERGTGDYPLTFDAKGLVDSDLMIRFGGIRDGLLTASIGTAEPNSAGTSGMFFLPAGVSLSDDPSVDSSDSSRDRIYVSPPTPVYPAEYFYYRVK